MKRAPKRKKTPEEVAKQNFWIRCRELRRIIELNFTQGDMHVVLTCGKEDRPSKEEAPKVIREFRDKLWKEYKKLGWQMKYIITAETGERGAVHWHMIINNVHSDSESTTRLIRKHWNRGRPYFSVMDDSGEYGKLAEYIVKETKKRMENEETIEKLSYMISRNMVRPVVEREEVNATSWKKEPTVPKGWYMVPGTLVNGINKFTGYPYQKYTIQKIPRKEKGDADSGRIHRHKHKGT